MGRKTSANMLYLLARCVKGAVRYGKNGNFNQSPDKRRHGTNPKTLAQNVYKVSRLLKGKTEFVSKDYHEILEMAQPGDLIYMIRRIKALQMFGIIVIFQVFPLMSSQNL